MFPFVPDAAMTWMMTQQCFGSTAPVMFAHGTLFSTIGDGSIDDDIAGDSMIAIGGLSDRCADDWLVDKNVIRPSQFILSFIVSSIHYLLNITENPN